MIPTRYWVLSEADVRLDVGGGQTHRGPLAGRQS